MSYNQEQLSAMESSGIAKFKPYTLKGQSSLMNYLLLGLVANGVLWGAALIYAKTAPRLYKSHWSINIPITDSSTKIELPGIGQADTQQGSPFRDRIQDPRVNYKFIIEKAEILGIAANQLNMSALEFSKPKIRIIDNTTLMELEIKGRTPQQAQQKAQALNQALISKLAQLRTGEIAQQERNMRILLERSQKNLDQAQHNFSEYQTNADLSSPAQLNNLSANIEQLRQQQAQTLAQQKEVNARWQQLTADLGLSAQQAANILLLRSDGLFGQHLQDYTTASTELIALNARMLPQHPDVIAIKTKQDIAQVAMLRRAKTLLGQPIESTTLQLPHLHSTSTGVNSLFQELITLQAQQQGLAAKAQGLGQQINDLEKKLQTLAQQEPNFTNLKRNVQIAETVFSSTLTQLDLQQSQLFSSYPPIQILTQPSLPTKPGDLRILLVLLATTLGSLLITMSLIWHFDSNQKKA